MPFSLLSIQWYAISGFDDRRCVQESFKKYPRNRFNRQGYKTNERTNRQSFFIQESLVSQVGIAQDGQQKESQTIGDSDSRINDSKVSEHFSRLINTPNNFSAGKIS